MPTTAPRKVRLGARMANAVTPMSRLKRTCGIAELVFLLVEIFFFWSRYQPIAHGRSNCTAKAAASTSRADT